MNGTRNPFEYYFEQPGGVSVEQLKAQQSVIKSRKENAALAGTLNASGNGYDWSEEYLEEMGRISAKYIHLNSETKKWMTDQIDSTIRGKRAIGVHVRGTDFKRNYKRTSGKNLEQKNIWKLQKKCLLQENMIWFFWQRMIQRR